MQWRKEAKVEKLCFCPTNYGANCILITFSWGLKMGGDVQLKMKALGLIVCCAVENSRMQCNRHVVKSLTDAKATAVVL